MNLHYDFYKGYYNDLLISNEIKNDESKNSMKDLNQKMLEMKIVDFESMLFETPGMCSFELAVGYPGLMTGIGYLHETGEKEEIKAGFQFDYVTGQPMILASTVKGTLQSVFRGEKRTYLKEAFRWNDEKADEKITQLRILIFGEEGNMEKKGRGQDIFYDAVLANRIEDDTDILGKEVITPHRDPLKSPVPIPILKIKAGNVFRFAFELQDSVLSDGEIISADRKKKLFRQILKDFGIGAKTNVGFGVLEDIQNIEKLKLKKRLYYKKKKEGKEKEKKTGVCRNCGKETSWDPIKKRVYPYCHKCNREWRKMNDGKKTADCPKTL